MRTTASISGMTCAHCVRAVFTSLAGVEGISRADVSIGRAVIEHDGTVTPEEIRAAIAVAGYEVKEIKIDGRTLPLAP
ncbi:MAG TPA: heavy-metal-associated domain-containing protein [Gemmatimonadaceae bacterium]|jgi:copper chaperone CopZ|nr:heavy-metal-associated domain-containing protein [Gemmatimonadaceae bacterium]